MPDTKTKNYALRASVPGFLLYAGLGGAAIAVVAVVIGFFVAGSRQDFRSKDFPAKLSRNVVGIIEKYNRKQTQNGVVKYLVTADVAKTFDDNHQELENISLKLYIDGDETIFNRITADRAVYLPAAESDDFTVFFAGDVNILTRDKLEVRTDQLNYRSSEEIARAEESVAFSRLNISGRSFGAVVDIGRNTLELQKEVEIIAKGPDNNDPQGADLEVAELHAGYAFFEEGGEKVKLRNSVRISLKPGAKGGPKQPAAIESNTAEIDLVEREIRRIELTGEVYIKQLPTSELPDSMEARSRRAVALVDRSVETLSLFDDVDLLTKRGDGDPVNAKADSAVYSRELASYELTGNVRIVTKRDSLPFKAAASRAIYWESKRNIELSGAAEVSQGGDSVKGDTIFASLSKQNRLRYAAAESNGVFRQRTKIRDTTISGSALKAWFSETQQLEKAESRGYSTVNILPVDGSEYSRFRVSSKDGIDASFNTNGAVKSIKTIGRTSLTLDSGSNVNAASDKILTADLVTTQFKENGNELATANAIGNAELVVTPRMESTGIYKTTILAPRFDCTFFPGNNARQCDSTKRSKVVRDAIRGDRPRQNLESDKLTTEFERTSRSVRIFRAVGNSRFSEADRQGIASEIEYSEADAMVRLRQGSPTVWDSRARAKAAKIDWNTKDDVSNFAGGVSTTYFNQKQTGGAAPFSDADSPVFLTSASARFDHKKRTGVYIGDARAWQDNNYVRGEKIYLEEETGQFYAEGNVRSVLYDAYKTVDGKKIREPVFVSASSLLYRDGDRHLRYEKGVDMRQGTDRILGREADVFLDSSNSITRSVITGNVEITQPNKKATGDYAEYDAGSEVVVLRGNPAKFSDAVSGMSSGKVVTVDLKNNRIVNSGSTSVTGTGRIRSVYKVGKGRVN